MTKQQRAVVQIAQKHNGTVVAPQVTGHITSDCRETRRLLREMCRLGLLSTDPDARYRNVLNPKYYPGARKNHPDVVAAILSIKDREVTQGDIDYCSKRRRQQTRFVCYHLVAA